MIKQFRKCIRAVVEVVDHRQTFYLAPWHIHGYVDAVFCPVLPIFGAWPAIVGAGLFVISLPDISRQEQRLSGQNGQVGKEQGADKTESEYRHDAIIIFRANVRTV